MDSEFLKSALVDAIIPEDTVTEVDEILHAGAEAQSESNRLVSIKERELLFFDERLRTLAILRLPNCDEEQLNSYLARLSFKIDVWAVDESTSGEQASPTTAPPKDLVHTADAIQKNEPVVLASESVDGGQTLILAWEVEIVLNRPRFRVPQLSIILIPSAVVDGPPEDESTTNEDLTPFQPLEANVLEPMRFISGFKDNPPYLAAARLERVLPVPVTHKQRIHIQHVPSRRRKAVPATMGSNSIPEIQQFLYSPEHYRSPGHGHRPFYSGRRRRQAGRSIAEERPLRISDASLRENQHLNLAAGVGFTNPNIDVLSIVIHLDVKLNEKCRPTLIMDWTTHVDFTQALNPSFGAPSQPIQRPNRPTSLPVSNTNGGTPAPITLATSFQPTIDVMARSGLSISFTAPEKSVTVGQAFTWKVLVVNHSAKAVKIAIIPLPRVQRQVTHAQSLAKRHAPKSSTASFHPSERRHTRNGEDIDVAQAIVDENVVYAMHHSNSVPPEVDLMALTAELRIGPLAPGQCHESEIQMVAFEAGTLRIDAMRVVDLVREIEEGGAAVGVLTDIRDLPDVVVVKPADNEASRDKTAS